MTFPKLVGPSEKGVYQIVLGEDENWLHRRFLLRFLELLDVVEKHNGPTALVLCADGPKFFSNGLALEDLAVDHEGYLNLVHEVWRRILTASVPTVAAVNGHAFAGGAMLAFCCDYRVMNSEKGFMCINEVEMGIPLTPGLACVIKAKANRSIWVDLCLKAKRFSGTEAARVSLVDYAVAPGLVKQRALEIAQKETSKGNMKDIYGAIKSEVFAVEAAILKASSMGLVNELRSRL